MPIIESWLEQAFESGVGPNPNAMSLATVDDSGGPSARIVLLKQLVPDPGYLVFYTNYQSHKGRQLDAIPRAAAVLHWDSLGRQVRVTGPAVRSPESESDAYFAGRDRGSQIGAWASQQSRPIESRQAMLEQFQGNESEFSDVHTITRPPHWGGYRLWAQSVELWVHGEHRIHDRGVWTRKLEAAGEYDFAPSGWAAERLQP
jgi:pyridoxamine 5'-phosphate oxidase